MNDIVDEGALFRETIYDWADRTPHWQAEIRLWYDRWIELASPRIEGSIALQRALRAKGVPVFALTNFGKYSFEEALPKMDFLTDFDRLYVSGRMGVIKPDPRIYEMVEADCGMAPDRLLFTDDRTDNITAAARRGWRTPLSVGAAGQLTFILNWSGIVIAAVSCPPTRSPSLPSPSVLPLAGVRRILAVCLPWLPAERLARQQKSAPPEPLVLVANDRGRQIIRACCPAAAARPWRWPSKWRTNKRRSCSAKASHPSWWC